MKKNILLVILILIGIFVFCGKEVSALEYVNLIDVNQIVYNNETNVFYSEQQIKLLKNKNYTFIASSNFFGDADNSIHTKLHNKRLGVKAKDLNGNTISLTFQLQSTTSHLYYATATPTEECIVTFTDFLTKGFDINTLPKDELILFKGVKEDFQGFRKPDHLEGFSKVDKSLDIYTSCNNPIRVEDISKRLRWYDNELGFQDNLVIVSNNYNNNKTLGNYAIVYEAVDNANNKTTLTVNVKVVDNEPPVIVGPDYVEVDCYLAEVGPEKIHKYYMAYDNVDGDISKNIKTDTWLMFYFELGVKKDYEYILTVTDSSNNTTKRTIIVKARDILPPELVVSDLTVNLSELGLDLFQDLFPMAVESVSDYSGEYTLAYNCEEVIGKMGFSGTFKLHVTASDPEGNKTEKISTIKIIDDIAPEFYLYTDLIDTTVETAISIDELKEIISDNLYNDGILYDDISLISCDYFSNENIPGKYEVKYAYSYKGETNYVVGTINVAEPEEEKSPVIFILIVGVPLLFGIAYAIKKSRELY